MFWCVFQEVGEVFVLISPKAVRKDRLSVGLSATLESLCFNIAESTAERSSFSRPFGYIGKTTFVSAAKVYRNMIFSGAFCAQVILQKPIMVDSAPNRRSFHTPSLHGE